MALGEDLPYSDLTVVCSGKSFKIHKIKLYEYSDWFKTALASRFQGTAATITLEEDDPKLFEAMLKHCYRQSYEDIRAVEDDATSTTSWGPPCIDTFDGKLFCLADKYQCRPLALEIAAYFERMFTTTSLTSSEVFVFLDIVYDLPSGSLITVLQDMFRRILVPKLPTYLKAADFQKLYQRHLLLASDCLDMIRQHYPPKAR